MSNYSKIFNTNNSSSNIIRATQKQIEYVAILRNDCGFSLAQFKDYLKSRYNGVANFDELSIRDASLVIDDLKCRKKQLTIPLKSEDEDDE